MNTPDIYAKNFWDEIDLGDAYRNPFKSNIRTLFISGTMDSNTPPENAEAVKKHFTNADHLLVKYAGHEDMLTNEEIHRAIIHFYRGGNPASREIVLPKTAFVPVDSR